MSGIPTYTSAPVNANSTTNEEDTHTTTSRPEPATAIQSALTTPPNHPILLQRLQHRRTRRSTLPRSQTPGAAPTLPIPTATTASGGQQPPLGNVAATATTPLAPTSAAAQSPPAPQPGARPEPPSASAAAPSAIPPPPKAGEPIPPSLSSPAPATATSTTAPAQKPFTQSYSYQSPTVQQQQAIPNSTSTPFSSVYQSPGAAGRPQGLPTHYGGSGGGSGGVTGSIFAGEDEPSMFNTAKAWMNTAGNKLAEVEAEVWKRINDAHGEK
ncbi:hypothetical protein N7510_001881 [Penicillium lagena]|uniref:uncharacterized protein n=1 Tax=Penicillium lagena TaxID=94218 RepID=UPI0025401E5F|nr:uncharacterized protein N7510_001881 [Penicillium lagena]KAJ5625572.1 hypothetical protein N7510_001881 [Penicillium lagena]